MRGVKGKLRDIVADMDRRSGISAEMRSAVAMMGLDEKRKILVERIAENISIYAGTIDPEKSIPQATQLVSSFEAVESPLPQDDLEIENWSRSHLDKGGRFLVLGGGRGK